MKDRTSRPGAYATLEAMQLGSETARYVSSEVRFYSVKDISEMTGWSKNVVLKLFNHPDFPATDFGKAKMVEAHALIDFFSVRRMRADYSTDDDGAERERKKEELKDELKRRMRETA